MDSRYGARSADWMRGPSSQSMPSQRRSSMVSSMTPGLMRGVSRSSMRRTMRQPRWRATAQLTRKVRALPRCRAPVGEGARRVTSTLTRARYTLSPGPSRVRLGDRMDKLTEAQVTEALKEQPEWALVGEAIQRTYGFKDFITAMRF